MTGRQSAPATVSEAAWLVALLPPDLKPGLIVTAIFSAVANGQYTLVHIECSGFHKALNYFRHCRETLRWPGAH